MNKLETRQSSPLRGVKDAQTVSAGGRRAMPLRIADVQVFELGNVITRSGWLMEVFRLDWPVAGSMARQINWVHLNPDGVTDWHLHERQTDHLVGVGGTVKLVLFDDRNDSPTRGQTEVIRLGAAHPVMVVVPPRLWHALRNESGMPSGYINVTDQLYVYEDPDNWRLDANAVAIPGIPDIL